MNDAPQPQPEINVDRFPALRRLAAKRGNRVPFVQQLEAADCGAACLAMVLGFHGRVERLDTLRDAVRVDRSGTDAGSLVMAAERFGLRGRGVKLDIGDLGNLPAGSILHWEFNHFVVFERVSRRGVELVDPGFGRRFVPLDTMRRSFTGIALVFEPSDDFAATPAGKSRVWAYLRQLLVQRHLVGRVIVTSVLLRLFALALPVLTALVVDRVVPRGDRDLLVVVGVGLGAVLLFQLVSRLVRAHLLLQLRTNLDTRMTLGFLDHLVGLPYEFFQRRSTGDLLMRVSSNTQIREVLTATMLSALLDGGLVVLYLGVILIISPGLAAVALTLGVLQISVFVASRSRYRELMSQDLESQARSQSYLVQMLAGIETLKVTGAEHRAVGHWSNLFVDSLNVSLARGRLGAITDAVTSTLQLAAPLVLVGFGAYQVMSGSMSLGAMLAATALATSFLMPLSTLVDAAFQLQQLASYVERIDDVLSTEPEQRGETVAAPPRLTGHIELRGVSFRYGPHQPLAVRDVSLTVEPGTTVAIVGRSGSGKSTLAALLLGLYKPSEGSLRYDGHDLAHLDVRAVRRQLGIVPQQPFLFGGTVRDNIALADPSVPLERVVAAARAACIDADIVRMPMRYDSILADGGASMSGGQRQRLALARALLHGPAILLLDEATSALDATTERAVVANLANLGCTRVVIAHRLSTVADADMIVVMDRGQIVETGTHRELLARGGSYADLIAAQTTVPTPGWIT